MIKPLPRRCRQKLHDILKKYPVRFIENKSAELQVYVDRKKALFSTWYEFFPRSTSSEPGKHGTFKDCEKLLPRVAAMGFDTLYFPPVHPIGEVNRKGRNNATNAEPGDVGSPWGIGSKSGGHQSVHPELGTLSDFKSLVKKAKALGIEVAMDYALQAAPDHPWVKEHKSWFKWRPDGTVQYAENPPKKYQDIQPIYFESDDWKKPLARIVRYCFILDRAVRRQYFFASIIRIQSRSISGAGSLPKSRKSIPMYCFLPKPLRDRKS
jgi:starch synthase (maltosyl-transferring)